MVREWGSEMARKGRQSVCNSDRVATVGSYGLVLHERVWRAYLTTVSPKDKKPEMSTHHPYWVGLLLKALNFLALLTCQKRRTSNPIWPKKALSRERPGSLSKVPQTADSGDLWEDLGWGGARTV